GGRRGREVGRRRGGGRRHGGGGGRGGRGGAGRLSRRRQGAGRLQDDLVAGSVGGVHERQLVAELELRRRLAAVEGAADDGELDRLAVAGDRDEPEDVLVRRERALHGHLLADAVGRAPGVVPVAVVSVEPGVPGTLEGTVSLGGTIGVGEAGEPPGVAGFPAGGAL